MVRATNAGHHLAGGDGAELEVSRKEEAGQERTGSGGGSGGGGREQGAGERGGRTEEREVSIGLEDGWAERSSPECLGVAERLQDRVSPDNPLVQTRSRVLFACTSQPRVVSAQHYWNSWEALGTVGMQPILPI